MAIADRTAPLRSRTARGLGAAALALLPALGAAPSIAQPTQGGTATQGAPATAPSTGADASADTSRGLSAPGAGGDSRRTTVVPGIRATVLGSDNIDLQPKGREQSGMLYEVMPYVQATFASPSVVGAGFYGLRLQWRDGGLGSRDDVRQELRGWADARLVPDLMRVYVAANVFDTIVSPFGTASVDPGSQTTNRTQYRDFQVAPYLYGRFDGEGTWLARYSARVIDPGGAFQRSTAQSINGDVRSDLVRRRFGWQVRGEVYDVDYQNGLGYMGADVDLLGWWRPMNTLRVGAGAAYSRNDLLADAQGRHDGWGPSAAFEWQPAPRTFVQGRWAERYYGNSSEVRASHRTGNTVLGLSWYSGLSDGNRSGRLGLNTSTLYDASSQPGTPPSSANNSVAQSLASQNLISAAGTSLGSGLINSPLVYVDELVASVGWVGQRNAVVATAFVNNRRTAVPFATGTVENIEQRGGSLQLTHRLTPRAAFTATGRRTVSESLLDGSKATLDGLWLTWDYRLTQRATTSLGGRLQRQRGEGLALSYDEAALFGSFDYRF